MQFKAAGFNVIGGGVRLLTIEILNSQREKKAEFCLWEAQVQAQALTQMGKKRRI